MAVFQLYLFQHRKLYVMGVACCIGFTRPKRSKAIFVHAEEKVGHYVKFETMIKLQRDVCCGDNYCQSF